MVENQKSDEILEEKEINLLEIINTILKRKKFIFIACFSAAILTAGYSLILPNIYSATARVLPPQKEGVGGLSAMLGQMGGVAGAVVGGGGANANELFVSIIKSRTLGESVIKKLYPDKKDSSSLNAAWDSLNRAVKVQSGKDGIISITAEDRDPKQAALLANTFVAEFNNTLVRLNLSKAGKDRLFLESRLDMIKNDLKTAEEDLKAFAEKNNFVQFEAQAKSVVDAEAKLKTEIASREAQLAILRNSQTDNSYEVKELVAGIRHLKGELAKLSGNQNQGSGASTIKSTSKIGLEYMRKMRELKAQEALFEQISKQYEIAKMNEAKDSSSIQVIDDAREPEGRISPRRTSMVLLATFVAFFVSVVIVFVQNYLANMSEKDREIIEEIKRSAVSLK